jgi:hypothetical protein
MTMAIVDAARKTVVDPPPATLALSTEVTRRSSSRVSTPA